MAAQAKGGPRRVLFKIAVLLLVIVAANLAADWVVEMLSLEVRPSNETLVHRAIMTSAIIYALLMAVPFVPGVEIGLGLIAMFGPKIVLLVYLCTLAGLSLSFAVGRFIPQRALMTLFSDLHLRRTSRLLREIEHLSLDERLALLVSKAPHRIIPVLLRHRYIALALALNLPGNIVIGGGGGIALMAGISRLYSVPAFLVTVALGIAPVPLAVLLFGERLLN